MKTDATFAGMPSQLAEGRGTQAPGSRWLADLERAWLEVRPVLPQRPAAPGDLASAGSAEPPAVGPCVPAVASNPSAASLPRAGQSSHAADRAPSAVTPRPSHEATTKASAPDDVRSMALSVGPGSMGAPALAERSTGVTTSLASVAPIAASALQLPQAPTEGARPIEALPLSTAGRTVRAASADAAAGGEETVAAALQERPLESPTYGRRLLQVSGSDELQINLRDAALTAPQQEAVAQALFAQLGSTGAALRRVYLNGQRYEPQGDGIRAAEQMDGAARAASPADPLDPTSILNHKE